MGDLVVRLETKQVLWRRKRSKLSLCPLSPVVADILQVAYYRGPLVTRARMLESRGHHVTSVLGNDEAFGLDAAVIAAADLIVIGFSAPHPIRAAMIRWFKQHYPNIPVVALRFHSAESFPEADGGTVSDDPEVWLAAVARTLKKSA
ncbi:MAG: hypothetical protein JWN63_1956 [Candidatus Acidoferrum typicum]|nr:hypothetical protein [Candidatus Acidoferrum typicum]